jgi:hypothetical protein
MAVHSELYSFTCSNSIRTARSRTSGEYLVLVVMTLSSQIIESPANPGRFRQLVLPTLFQWKDRKKHNRTRTMPLHAHEFIRRFLTHILPQGFAKIRYFGFLANRHRRSRLSLCRRLFNAPPPEIDPQLIDWKIRHQALTGESLDICPACKNGRMHMLQILPPPWKRRSDQHPITLQNQIHAP